MYKIDPKDLMYKIDPEYPPIIGAVQVNKPIKYDKTDYECAAWWEEHVSELGVHPIYLTRNHLHPKNLVITAHIKAMVTNDYFPALWGGVALSNQQYKPKHLGEARTIYKTRDVVEAIQATGTSPGSSEIDWYIDPVWWPVFAEEAEAELQEAYRRLPEFWEERKNLTPETFKSRDPAWGYNEDFRSKTGMIAHFGMTLEKWGRRIENIAWCIDRRSGRQDTEYSRNLFSTNTKWAVDAYKNFV